VTRRCWPGRPRAGRAWRWRKATFSPQLASARELLDGWTATQPGLQHAARQELSAGIAALEGDADAAAEQFVLAHRALGDLGAVFERALSQLTMVATLPSDRSDVAAAAADAREVFTRLGATPFIARLDEFLARRSAPAGARER
jgi:hypothetical protein